MISQTAEYALRAAVHLADQAGETGHPLTAPVIAAATQVPVGYLSKVLQNLSRAGIITSQRGPGGGFRLAREATDITIYEVVQAVDTLPRIHKCPLGLEEHERLCPLHRRIDEAMALVEKAFRETTIADLMKQPSSLCRL